MNYISECANMISGNHADAESMTVLVSTIVFPSTMGAALWHSSGTARHPIKIPGKDCAASGALFVRVP